MRLLYSALLYVLFPLVLLRMLWRSRRAPAYRRRLAQRFGYIDIGESNQPRRIWVHAVSVGEVQAALPVVEMLLARYEGYEVLLTTTTPTGSQLAKARLGDRVTHAYAPWDLPGSVQRFLHHVRPCLLILIETELWPNWLHYCAEAECPVILANARMSARSRDRYARFARVSPPLFSQLDHVACQSAVDRDRFLTLGVSQQALTIMGSLKYEASVDEAMRQHAEELRSLMHADKRFVFIAASTHAEEEEAVLHAFRRLREHDPASVLLLVPRHPERFDDVHRLCLEQGWGVQRRSAIAAPDAEFDILLCDSMGELATLYGVANLAFIGGSLIRHGGHNPLEAAAWGVPILCGPHLFNFAAIAQELAQAGALLTVEDADQLADCAVQLTQNSQRRETMGAAGENVMARNGGACERLMKEIRECLGGQI